MKNNEWIELVFWVLMLVLVLLVLFVFFITPDFDTQKQSLSHNYLGLEKAEVINGHLYVGYEDGVRIGYHQDYNGIWYRCTKDCEVLG